MKNSTVMTIIGILAFYFGLRYYGGDIGRKILYPITLFVTFLHEFGHAVGALITGGEVLNVQISQDGSGFTRTVGGNRSVTLMGGYLGSALFGNLLFFIGVRAQPLVKPILVLLGLSMVVTGFVWFNSVFTTGVLILFTLVILFLAFKTNLGKHVLVFLGLASILYIIQDFNVGPSSDLAAYAKEMIFIPATIWKYIWLGLVVLLFFFNIRILIKTNEPEEVY